MSSLCIELRDVRVRRGGRVILETGTVRIRRGGFVGIAGPNGAGKTTLLRVCCGLLKPNRGSAWLDGTDLTAAGLWQRTALRRRIGYIPQTTRYNSDLPFTVRDVVAMGRAGKRGLLRRLTRVDYENIDFWLNSVGLYDRRYQTFRSLSGGQRQKVLLARAMCQEPCLLMLDEPCSNLDPFWRRRIIEMVQQLGRDTGITVLMVSHQTDTLGDCCDRILFLRDGKIVADGTADIVKGKKWIPSFGL